MFNNRKVVCLCGSTRFKAEFEQANKEETLKGNIVLSVGFFGHNDPNPPDDDIKSQLDILHLEKMELSDEIVLIHRDLYIGESTRNEIKYATTRNKPIRLFGTFT